MYKIYCIIVLSFILTACAVEHSSRNSLSLTSAKTSKLSPNVYRVMVGGNAFSTSQDILERLENEAKKICGTKKYSIKSNKQGKVDSFSMVGANGTVPVNISAASGEAIIECK